MEDKKEIVSYIAFEGEMTRLERIIHRLWILCIALLIALLGTNIGWIIYESQFEYFKESTTTQEINQEANADGGGNAIINGEGEVNVYGEDKTDNNDNDNNN